MCYEPYRNIMKIELLLVNSNIFILVIKFNLICHFNLIIISQ